MSNNFRESLNVENFINNEMQKVRTDNKLNNKQKQERLLALKEALIEYRLTERNIQAKQNVIARNEEQWEK